jgi:CheY-like chemotaxis protein
MTSATRARILLIDDDSAMLETARDLLESAGFEVLTYSGAFNLLGAVGATAPDLVLLDVSRPLVPQDDPARRMRDDPRLCRIPFALLSSNDEAELRRLARETGACGYVLKSDLGFLASRVGRLLERVRRPAVSPLHVME